MNILDLPIELQALVLEYIYKRSRHQFIVLISQNTSLYDIAYQHVIPQYINHKGIIHACGRGYLEYCMRFIDTATANAIESGMTQDLCASMYLAAAIDRAKGNILDYLLTRYSMSDMVFRRSPKNDKVCAYTAETVRLINLFDHDTKILRLETVDFTNTLIYHNTNCLMTLAMVSPVLWGFFSARIYQRHLTYQQCEDVIDVLVIARKTAGYDKRFTQINAFIVESLVACDREDLLTILLDDAVDVATRCEMCKEIVFYAAHYNKTHLITDEIIRPYTPEWRQSVVYRLYCSGLYKAICNLHIKLDFPVDSYMYIKMDDGLIRVLINNGKIPNDEIFKLIIDAIKSGDGKRVSMLLPSLKLDMQRTQHIIEIIKTGLENKYPCTRDMLTNPAIEPSCDMWSLEGYWLDHVRKECSTYVNDTSIYQFTDDDILLMSHMMSEASHVHRQHVLNLIHNCQSGDEHTVMRIFDMWKSSRIQAKYEFKNIVAEYLKLRMQEIEFELEHQKIQQDWLNKGVDRPEWEDDSIDAESIDSDPTDVESIDSDSTDSVDSDTIDT